MDGTVAIEFNRAALKRIVETLVDMAGLADGPDPRAEGEPRRTIPRILWLAILRLLRPAESAARRLIIAAARGVVVSPARLRKPKPKTMEPLLRRFGIAVMVGSRFDESVVARTSEGRDAAAGTRPPGGARFTFPLFDPPRRFCGPVARGHHQQGSAIPRILVAGISAPSPLPPPPSPDGFVGATRLIRRLAALSAALDDLPGQARRFARWKARRADASGAQEEKNVAGRRLSPLRGGQPPGGRLARYDPSASHPQNTREVDEILAHAHALAVHALESPDTS